MTGFQAQFPTYTGTSSEKKVTWPGIARIGARRKGRLGVDGELQEKKKSI
jgi:hypothetical protein